jgi:hypothetical protein
MTVPVTAIYKDHRLATRQDNIRLSWQVSTVEPKAVTEFVKQRPNCSFWQCVLRLYSGHVPAAVFF